MSPTPHHPCRRCQPRLLDPSGLVLAARRRFPVAVMVAAYALTLSFQATQHFGNRGGPAWLAVIVAFATAIYLRRRVAALLRGVTVGSCGAGRGPRPLRRLRPELGCRTGHTPWRRRAGPAATPTVVGAQPKTTRSRPPPSERGAPSHRSGSPRHRRPQHLGHQRAGQHRPPPHAAIAVAPARIPSRRRNRRRKRPLTVLASRMWRPGGGSATAGGCRP